MRNDIYVVYKKKTEPTTGGTVTPSTEETWPEEEDELPTFSKSSVNNGDGTNTISLEIAAAEKTIENASKANVIVIFDGKQVMKKNVDFTKGTIS